MNADTRRRLNAINQEFYRVTAAEFDQTRGQAWRGWDMMLPYLKRPASVLDVGCGNGRFGVFIAEKFGGGIHYHGVDGNGDLLQLAAKSLVEHDLQVALEQRDVVEQPPDSGVYDLVVLFGVMHHIPGYAERQTFIRELAQRVAPGGMLAFACWRFYEFERFRERIVPWGDDLAGAVEPHDYLLDWRRGEVALRYCHYVDDQEHAALVRASGLTEIATYRADGFTGTVNRYSLLKNPLIS